MALLWVLLGALRTVGLAAFLTGLRVAFLAPVPVALTALVACVWGAAAVVLGEVGVLVAVLSVDMINGLKS